MQWRWAPFFALVLGALFINLFIALIVPSRIETEEKSGPSANVLTRPGLSDDDEEGSPSPFGAPGNAAPRTPTPPRGLPGFNPQAAPFTPGAVPPPPPPVVPPPIPEPPPPPPPPAAPPPEPPPPAPAPPPPAQPDPALQQRMMTVPLRGVQPPEGEENENPSAPPQQTPPAPAAPQ